jgi:hypothetical protein
MLRAIAAMVNWKQPAKTKKEAPKLPFGPGELYELCLERVPTKLACVPYDKGWFARLGKVLQQTNGLEREDMDRVVRWIEDGGIDYMESASFAHLIKHWNNWVTRARQWSQDGCDMGPSVEEFM